MSEREEKKRFRDAMYYQFHIYKNILKSHVLKETLVAKGDMPMCCASSLPCLRLIFIGTKKVQKLTRGLASERTIITTTTKSNKETELN